MKKSLAATTINERYLQSKIKNLSEALSTLNSLHTAWIHKAAFTKDQLSEETYSLDWLRNEWSLVDDFQTQVDEK